MNNNVLNVPDFVCNLNFFFFVWKIIVKLWTEIHVMARENEKW